MQQLQYSDGQNVAIGDYAAGLDADGQLSVGQVVEIRLGAATSNVTLAIVRPKVTDLPLERFYSQGIPAPVYVRRAKGGVAISGQLNDLENVLLQSGLAFATATALKKVA